MARSEKKSVREREEMIEGEKRREDDKICKIKSSRRISGSTDSSLCFLISVTVISRMFMIIDLKYYQHNEPSRTIRICN